MSDDLLEGKTVGQHLVEGFEGMAKTLKEASDATLLQSAVEAARTMGTRRLTRVSLLRIADEYMAYLAELKAIEQAESLPVYDGPAEELPHVEGDLKAAVARYRQMLQHPSGDGFPYESPMLLRDDQRVLIDYALARLAEDERLAEDDGEVPKAVLEELGFVFACGEWDKVIASEDGFRYIIRFTTHTAEPRWALGSGNEHIMTFAPLRTPTKRQLRRLIAALEG